MLVSLGATYGMTLVPAREAATGTGVFTIFALFASLAAISFPIFLTEAISAPSLKSVCVAVVAGYPIYSAVFLAGRRTETAFLFCNCGVGCLF